MVAEVQRSKKRRTHAEWMNGGTYVVNKARQSEFSGTRSATDLVMGLENEHRQAGLRQSNGCRQTVWPGTHDYSIVRDLVGHTPRLADGRGINTR